ncbi:hypothetical protein [Streptomyces sp. NPDC047981]|uniref:hypothetical protein n=1 Tax=Streptomyces sp. NPDC047981 TaxID=3154610 RepID=UPI003413EEB7
MPETRTQHWTRRSRELNKQAKAQLCTLYRSLGGLGGIHPPEKWRKDEVVTSITDMEWSRLPEELKAPDPVHLTPPCDVCGKGEGAPAHEYGGEHNYTTTHDPDKQWVPYREDDQVEAAGSL